MPPRSPPASVRTSGSSPTSHDASVTEAVEDSYERNAKRQQVAAPVQDNVLPPVSSLAGYGGQILPSFSSVNARSPPNTRILGVQNILNPTGDLETTRNMQRLDPSPGMRSGDVFVPSPAPLASPRGRKRNDATSLAVANRGQSSSRQPRRMLTPKSPSLRAISGTQGTYSGMGASSQSVPGESRVYTAEPGTMHGHVIPPLPQHPAFTLVQNDQSQLQYETGRSAFQTSYGSSNAPHSLNTPRQTGSPGASSSTYDREQVSPRISVSRETPVPAGPMQPPLSTAETSSRSLPRPFPPTQPAYQMQLDTETGPMILPVEVDVQQASRLADEKRKRNAGASARFRQRRKEKEHASSQQISTLNRRLRDLEEEVTFYRRERDFFRDVVERTPGPPMQPRPLSPRRQPLTEPISEVDYMRQIMSDSSGTRRRSARDRPPSFPPTVARQTPPGPAYAQTQPPHPPPPPPPYLPPPIPTMGLSAPSTMQDSRGLASGPSGPSNPSAYSTIPFDPYRRDTNPR